MKLSHHCERKEIRDKLEVLTEEKDDEREEKSWFERSLKKTERQKDQLGKSGKNQEEKIRKIRTKKKRN